jgi:hypothetical protein
LYLVYNIKEKKEGSGANILTSEGEKSRRLGLITKMLSLINLTPRQILAALSNQES